jgi:MFS transporter, DHA1 family, multidrug resistance protein
MNFWLSSWPRGVPLLLTNSLLMSIGFYALIPNLSVYVTHTLGWSPFLAGVLLMVRQFSQQGPMMLTGMIADRVGYRLTLTLGFLLRGIGFTMFAMRTDVLWMFLSAIVAGLGGSLFEPTGDAALTTLTETTARSRTYAVKKVMDNVGIILSALIGSLLVGVSFRALSLFAGAVFILAGILTHLRLPAIKVQIKPIAWGTMWRTVIRDKPFVQYVIVMVGFYFMYMQLYLTIPAKIVDITHRASSVSLVFFMLSFLMMVFQVPINAYVSKFDLVRSVQVGLIMMGLGLITLGTAPTITRFVVGVIVFAFGMMTVEPASFDITARLANPNMTATYFGFYYLAMAIGGGLSQGTGGLLLQIGKDVGLPSLLWWVALIISGISALVASPLKKFLAARQEEHLDAVNQ